MYLHLPHGGEMFGAEPGAEPGLHGLLPVQFPLLLGHFLQVSLGLDGETVSHVGHHQLPSLNAHLHGVAGDVLDEGDDLAVSHLGDELGLDGDDEIPLLDAPAAGGTGQAEDLRREINKTGWLTGWLAIHQR